MEKEEQILIPLSEYKELLETKGKYEELKKHPEIRYIYVNGTKPADFTPTITWGEYKENNIYGVEEKLI